MDEFSENIVIFKYLDNYSFEMVIDNKELASLYNEKLNICLSELDKFVSILKDIKIDKDIYFGFAQGLIKRFEDLVNTIGSINPEQLSKILDDVSKNFLTAAMTGLSRIQNDWSIVCKLAFEDKYIQPQYCRLTGIKLMNADPHNNGQVPWQCKITRAADNKQGLFFYKPSPIVIDMLLNGNTVALRELNLASDICKSYKISDIPPSFAELMQDPKHTANLTFYPIVPLKDRRLEDSTKLFDYYGYMKLLIPDSDINITTYNLEKHRRYSMQAGKVAIAALILGQPDIHYDNFFIIDGQMFVVDTENSLMPAIPNPDFTQLFREGLGGFYGAYLNKPNRFFYVQDNRYYQYKILEPEFMQGARELCQTLKQRYLDIHQWLNHKLFLRTPLRVVPLATQNFYDLRRDVMDLRMQGISLDKIIITDLDRFTIPDEIAQLEQHPQDTYSDTEMQSAIFIGNNFQYVIECLYTGDVPAFYMLANDRRLLTLSGKPIIMPKSINPLNYFLHVPIQALHDRIQYILHFPLYRDALLKSLESILLRAHGQSETLERRHELQDQFERSQEIAQQIYKWIDYTCILSYFCIHLEPNNRNLYLENTVLALNDLISRIAVETAKQASQEMRLTTVDISILIIRAEEIVKSLLPRYREAIAFVGQQYAAYGKVADMYNSVLLLQNQLLQQVSAPVQGGVETPKSVTTPSPKVSKELEEKADKPKPSITRKTP